MKRSAIRLFWMLTLTVVLSLGFAAYLQPAFMLDLANRIMLCF